MGPEEHAMTDSERTTGRSPLMKRVIIYSLILLFVFLLGLVPMWLRARQRGNELEATRVELRRSQMRSALSAAALDARSGNYEPARKAMSEFFTALNSELERESSAFDVTQRDAVRPLLTQRDEIITLLARSDPAAADRLTALDASYRKVMGNAQPLSNTQ